MKTREEVEELKRQWKKDPHWDIADTEGFEDYRDELLKFQEENKFLSEKEVEEYMLKVAKNFGMYRSLNPVRDFGCAMMGLINQIENMNEEIESLKRRLDDMDNAGFYTKIHLMPYKRNING